MPQKPNILFLLSDEHSHRCMGHVAEAAGGERVDTPTLDRLAAQGTVFSDAYCQMPLCTPSRISLLTGREVRRSGAWTNQSVLRPELPTIPKALAGAGYATCLIGKMHLGGNQQFGGFQSRPYGDLTGRCGHQWEPLRASQRTSMRGRTADAGVTSIPESLMQEQVVTTETVTWLREQAAANPQQPWFLCASFSRPHFPLTAPRRWFDRYWPGGVGAPRVPAAGDAYDHPMSVGMRHGFQAEAISQDETMRARAAYFACVSYLDEIIGDLVVRLEAAGLLADTVIVYATDHGEMAGEHGVWWKNGWYEGCTRVPFIVSTPAQRRGDQAARTCATPVALLDLFPTLCGLAGAAPPGDLDGVDLSPVVGGLLDPPERPVFCDNLIPRWGAGTEFRSLRWRQFKYVRFRDCRPLFFDLAQDPGEQSDLIARGIPEHARAAHDYLAAFAERSIDFDEAERERTGRDGALNETYAQNLPPATCGNQYLMPSGELVDADATLYAPRVLAEFPAAAFGDWPGAEPTEQTDV